MGTRRDDPAAAHHCFVSRGRAAHNIDALARHWWRKSWETDEITSALGQTLSFGATGAVLATLAAAPTCDQRPTRFARAFEGSTT